VSSKEGAIDQLKSNIQRFYEERANALLMREMQERLLQENFIELPDTFMKRWLKATNSEMTADDIEAQYPPLADNLRWSLLRDKLKDQYDIEVPDSEVRADFAQRILSYFQGQLPDHMIKSATDKFMKNEEEVEKTRQGLEMELLFAVLREQVSLVDKPILSEDLQRILDEVSGKAKKEQAESAELIDALEG
jgi:trigger factor